MLYTFLFVFLHQWDFTPTFRGFDSFVGFYSGGEDYFKHESRLVQSMGGGVGVRVSLSGRVRAIDDPVR